MWQVDAMSRVSTKALKIFQGFAIQTIWILKYVWKYNDSDILLLDADSIAKVQTRTTFCHL